MADAPQQNGVIRATILDGAGKPDAGNLVNEFHFLLPKGPELLIDDVFPHEPGWK